MALKRRSLAFGRQTRRTRAGRAGAWTASAKLSSARKSPVYLARGLRLAQIALKSRRAGAFCKPLQRFPLIGLGSGRPRDQSPAARQNWVQVPENPDRR